LAHASRALIGISREMIADAEAVRLTHNPAALVSALRRIEAGKDMGALGDEHDSMLIVGATHGPLATHPTLEERAGALARTTGSLMLATAPRLDTRPLAGRRAPGFGWRPDPALERIAVLAEAPRQRGLWGAFRSVRDPERNLMGLNRRAAAIIAGSLLGIGILYQPSLAHPGAVAKIFDPEMLRPFAGMGATVARCVLAFGATDEELEKCEKDAAEGGRLFEHIPLFAPKDGRPREYLTPRESEARRAAQKVARGCVSGRLAPDGSENLSMDIFRRFGERAPSKSLELPPGPDRDAALVAYALDRLNLIEVSLDSFGEPGFAALRQAVAGDDHEAVLELLRRRLEDREFRRRTGSNTSADIELLVSRPTGLRPCRAKRPTA
ncbi:MAG TPA: hypothetical protein VGB57_08170, partial [Allosphingosinicella sp.]